MKTVVTLLTVLAVFAAICILAPAPNRALLNFTVAVPELAHWFLLLDILALALAAAFYRKAIVLLLPSLCVAAWPVITALRLTHAGPPLNLAGLYRNPNAGNIQPERLPMNMLYYPPATPGLHPALVDIYGGAWQRGTPGDDEQFNRYMASRGYAVFAIDYRHAPPFIYPAQIDDVRAAVTFISSNAAKYSVDSARIALCGRSSGGQLALLAAYTSQDVPIRAVIALYPPTNLARGYAELPYPDPIDVQETLATYMGGTPDGAMGRYRAASPVTYASNRVPPTLLIQGSRDHIVKAEFTRALYDRLLVSGNQAALLELPWAEHSFDAVFFGLGNRLALAEIEAFLRDNL